MYAEALYLTNQIEESINFYKKKPFVKNDSLDFAAQISFYIVIINEVCFIGNVILLI